ncbi:MAG: 30S ribosomal protein S20 [Gemmatimonadales bacterium]|nr:30S ribosomal protein S20 [Gemmatimonadales bacterium]
MPNNKSCKKRLVTSAKRNERNRQNRAMMRSQIKTYRSEIEAASPEGKVSSLTAMYSLIDTQARKGLMPKSRAARLKSRMAAAATK